MTAHQLPHWVGEAHGYKRKCAHANVRCQHLRGKQRSPRLVNGCFWRKADMGLIADELPFRVKSGHLYRSLKYRMVADSTKQIPLEMMIATSPSAIPYASHRVVAHAINANMPREISLVDRVRQVRITCGR